MRFILIGIAGFMFLVSCDNMDLTSSKTEDTIEAAISDTAYSYVEKFRSIQDCEGCDSVAIEITFINDILSYRKKIIRKHQKLLKYEGSYTTERGYQEDEDATVYVLDDDKPAMEQRMLKIHDDTLLLLDHNGEIMDSTLKHMFVRVRYTKNRENL